MCLLLLYWFLLVNKTGLLFAKSLFIPIATPMIMKMYVLHTWDVFPAFSLPKTIDMIIISLKPFLTSPAMLISATNQLTVLNCCAIHSVGMYDITNYPFSVSMPHFSIRFWSLIRQGLKLIPKFCKIMYHRNQKHLSKTSLYCLISRISLVPTQLQSGKVTNCVLFK